MSRDKKNSINGIKYYPSSIMYKPPKIRIDGKWFLGFGLIAAVIVYINRVFTPFYTSYVFFLFSCCFFFLSLRFTLSSSLSITNVNVFYFSDYILMVCFILFLSLFQLQSKLQINKTAFIRRTTLVVPAIHFDKKMFLFVLFFFLSIITCFGSTHFHKTA